MLDLAELRQVIREALNGHLRCLLDICNTAGDREFLAARIAEAILLAERASWSESWPIEPGYYWFYGKHPQSICSRAEVHLVKVAIAVSGSPYVSTPGFWLASAGYWMPAMVPLPPEQLTEDEY